jgi:hypothetical protein
MVKPHGRDRRGRLAARDPGRRLRPALHRPGPPAVGPSTRARAGARPSRGAGDRGGAAAAHGDSAGRRVDRSKLSPPRSLLMARLVLRPMIGFNHGVPCGSVGTSILSTPCTGSPSRHWTARVWVARPSARGSTRSRLPAAGRCPDSGDRTDVAGSREAPDLLRPPGCADASADRSARALTPSGSPKGDEAMGVYCGSPRLRPGPSSVRRPAPLHRRAADGERLSTERRL